ncbi:helix-turn-helix domain-containing protein [Kitasatospora sp. NPDC001175]|uniref:helix-turn-helix domain-containing protein n=1 Tax=Kitasatospora sp. NPDC001175 TaxID=3157103 RepID=UPI003CFC32A0
MSTEAVKWAMDDAPMLLTEKGRPDTTARHVLQALAEHAHKDGGGARPSNRRLRYRTGYDERTIRRALRRLEDGGLIVADGTVSGCTQYRLMLAKVRPMSDWEALEVEEERLREAAAARKRKSRAKTVTHSDRVTVTSSNDVTGPVSRTLRPDVTHSGDVTEGDVTHSECVMSRTQCPPNHQENHPTTEPPGNHHHPDPLPNLPAVPAAAEADERPAWLRQLQDALSANSINVPWTFKGKEELLLQNDVQRLGIPLMVRFAVQAAQAAQRGPFSSRFFYPGWRSIPTPVDPNVIPMQPKTRQQQETDSWFDRAMARAQARDEQRKEIS